MNRRPWLLVLLAFLYCVSPLIYPVFVWAYFGTPLGTVAKETLDSNSALRNFETFVLPIALGLFTFFARRISYFVVVVGSIYLVSRNAYVFASMGNALPLSGLIAMNLLVVFVIVYLSRKSTRAIYFNAKMRWWETDPRYVVGWSARMARAGTLPKPVKVRNIAIGGAAIETPDHGFQPHETVQVAFRYEGKDFEFPAGVVWEQRASVNPNVIGVRWVDGKKSAAWHSMRALVKELKAKGTPTTRPSDWWRDAKAWFTRADNT